MLKGLKLKLGLIVFAILVAWIAVSVFLMGGSHSSWFILTIIVLALVNLYVLVFSFNRLVLAPLDSMNKMLKRMAEGEGDLTLRLEMDAEDEIGEMARNLNLFLDRLHGLVSKAQGTSERVLGLTGRIRDRAKSFMESSQDQSRATNENFKSLERMDLSLQEVAGSAESLSITSTDSSATVTEMTAQVEVVAESATDLSTHVEEASSSISEMSNSIKEVAENVKVLAELAYQTAAGVTKVEVSIREVESRAKESAMLSQEVSHDADTLGNEAIARTIEAMERIKETVEGASVVIERLGARSAEIGQIVKVIDEITNQTSLLALNAAILAAQAGEHGKGFEVVANEVKELAERTSSSTGEISRLIKSVQHESKAAVESMRAGKDRVLEGTRMAYGAADALAKILESSNRSKETATGIEAATTRQVEAVRNIADAVKNVHERIQQIERATQEQSRGSE
ncbi:MAG TPA: methyl-accepting chemotaxis protein, partial [Nitrospirota bacterium]|nr:methyl-accepting chemotaxis protein [Nitrospirota bacterium]